MLIYLPKKHMMKLIDKRKLTLLFIICVCFAHDVFAVSTQIPIAPEPVGSGARALGQSAFIAVVDDATAASWNPAGLIQLERPETSFVGAWKVNTIDPKSATPSDTSYKEDSWSLGEINFMSYAQPIVVGNTDIVISINYHQVYDLGMEFNRIHLNDAIIEKVRSKGAISACSLATGLSMPSNPELTIGASFNWYTQSIFNDYIRRAQTILFDYDDNTTEIATETLDDIRGHNFTFGLLWDMYEKQDKLLTLGLVYHTPFTAKVEQKVVTPVKSKLYDMDIDFPLSIGAGLNYRHSDLLSVSFDIEWKEWSEFTHTGSLWAVGDDTLALRLGFESLSFPDIPESICALRGGVFYEPRPVWDDTMPVYGFSTGLGWTKRDQFSLDIAYQFRWGDKELRDFDYRIKEHFFVVSLIKYF